MFGLSAVAAISPASFGSRATLARHDALFPLDRLTGAAPLLRGVRIVQRRRIRGDPGPANGSPPRFNELGPSFVKLGQMLSTRADLLGDEIAADLRNCRTGCRRSHGTGAGSDRGRVRAVARPAVRVVRRLPAAAASIAQVHFAVTTDGHEVAVKVLRPGIARAFARDLELFLWLAQLTERTQPALRRLSRSTSC